MKVVQIAFLIFCLTVLANAQKSVLSGKVYDAHGALIIGAKVTATTEKEEKIETVTSQEGVYVLNLPFNQYDQKPGFKMAKYEIVVNKEGFQPASVKDFKFVPAFEGRMNLDFALDVYKNICPIIIDSEEQKNNKIKRKN